MMKKKVVVALGHRALGTTLPEQQIAVKRSAKVIADLVQEAHPLPSLTATLRRSA